MSNWLRAGVTCALGAVACAPGPAAIETRVVPSYDRYTGRLVQLSADQNGDGRLDQWTYLDGNRPLRGEADVDADGRIDRWEYFDDAAALKYVGTSSRNDGVEDTWIFPPATNGERQVGRSRHRDRRIDRREYFQGTTLLRAEEDTNGDGQTDKWDRYEGTILREVSFDTSLRKGRPDRRLKYDAQGRYEALEEDPDGDGTFVRLETAPAGKAGEKK